MQATIDIHKNFYKVFLKKIAKKINKNFETTIYVTNGRKMNDNWTKGLIATLIATMPNTAPLFIDKKQTTFFLKKKKQQ